MQRFAHHLQHFHSRFRRQSHFAIIARECDRNAAVLLEQFNRPPHRCIQVVGLYFNRPHTAQERPQLGDLRAPQFLKLFEFRARGAQVLVQHLAQHFQPHLKADEALQRSVVKIGGHAAALIIADPGGLFVRGFRFLLGALDASQQPRTMIGEHQRHEAGRHYARPKPRGPGWNDKQVIRRHYAHHHRGLPPSLPQHRRQQQKAIECGPQPDGTRHRQRHPSKIEHRVGHQKQQTVGALVPEPLGQSQQHQTIEEETAREDRAGERCARPRRQLHQQAAGRQYGARQRPPPRFGSVVFRHGRLTAIQEQRVAAAFAVVFHVFGLLRSPTRELEIVRHDARSLAKLLLQNRAHFLV